MTPNTELEDLLVGAVGTGHVDFGSAIKAELTHDEALHAPHNMPFAVVVPGNTEEVASVVLVAAAHGVPVTPRGSGTGLSGAATPVEGGILVSFERMNRILEIDTENHVAVVQAGVTLAELDEALLPLGLTYPVFPGEQSASIGGTVATNAGGMRAVKYGVTRHHVLGLEAVLGTGEVITAGGKFVKSTSGYDLTQLIIGSEGTLALVTSVVLRLHPRPRYQTTLLAPFETLANVSAAVAPVVASGVGPLLIEYIDTVVMAGITLRARIDLGIPDEIRERALTYLVIVLEENHPDRLEEDTQALATQLADLRALDVYVLPDRAGSQLIEAREQAFWAAKESGADDIIDVVVPRASIPEYLAEVNTLAGETASLVLGCGHAGDGNVHLSLWQADPDVRQRVLHDIIGAGIALGGAVSGEHGIGTQKRSFLAEFEDSVKIELMRKIKTACDPYGILNPGKIFESPERRAATR